MESITSQQQKCLLFFVRHGERLDELKTAKKPFIEYAFDPQLSDNGKQQSLKAGQNIRNIIDEMGYGGEVPLKIIVSPFIRTLQTAAYLSYGLNQNTKSQIITNPNICVKLSQSMKMDPLTKGTFAKNDQRTLISKYLDQKLGSIVNDEMTQLQKPKFPELKSKSRYIAGFNDIIKNHIVNCNKIDKQVIILVSHSDGINPFLSLNGGDEKIKSPCYCSTLAHEIKVERNSQQESGFVIEKTHIFSK
eukprot:403336211